MRYKNSRATETKLPRPYLISQYLTPLEEMGEKSEAQFGLKEFKHVKNVLFVSLSCLDIIWFRCSLSHADYDQFLTFKFVN